MTYFHGILINEPVDGVRPILEKSTAVIGLVATATLLTLRVRGALLIGIALSTSLAWNSDHYLGSTIGANWTPTLSWPSFEVAFEADVLDNSKVDLSLKLPLTERVIVKKQDDGSLQVNHPNEPELFEETFTLDGLRLETPSGELIAQWGAPTP